MLKCPGLGFEKLYLNQTVEFIDIVRYFDDEPYFSDINSQYDAAMQV